MSREGKLAKNTLIISIGTFLPKLASFITLPILTGYLTQVEYGTYDLITILVSLLLPECGRAHCHAKRCTYRGV